MLLPRYALNITIQASHSCINTWTVLITLKMFMYFLELLLYHKHKHKHNIIKHNTSIFYVVHYQEGSYIHRNFVYMIFSKGEIQSSTVHHFIVSLSLSQSLCTPSSQSSLFSQNDQYIHPYDMKRTVGLCKDIFPFTIYSLFIVWLKSVILHSCGPKAPHPQSPLQNGPKTF